jgi:flagellin
MAAGSLGVSTLSLDSFANAQSAISSIDVAIQAVDTFRATLGAKINRMTSAADNLANISMNTAASRSRIEDTDYAQATTELARTQIIQQAATAMLAQANQQPQAVLSLLK